MFRSPAGSKVERNVGYGQIHGRGCSERLRERYWTKQIWVVGRVSKAIRAIGENGIVHDPIWLERTASGLEGIRRQVGGQRPRVECPVDGDAKRAVVILGAHHRILLAV